MMFLRWTLLVCSLVLAAAGIALGQTNEIQVYGSDINKPGELSVTLHDNYTISGRTGANYPGGIVPNHALNGGPEFAYGVTEWWEVGAFFPVYTYTQDRQLDFDGFKVRSLFLVPEAEEREFFYGVNFEFSYNEPQWAQDRFTGEIRPIIGWHFGPVTVALNPIIDYTFSGFKSADFAPAARLGYSLTPEWAVAAEYYADYGQIRHFESGNQQGQTLFAVVDYTGEPLRVEFGIGHGFTGASDNVVLKLILAHSF